MGSTMFDGDTSDTFVNGFHIEPLAEVLPDEDEVTLVADSKLVDASLLGGLLEHELHSISPVPRAFGARAQAVERWTAESDEVRPLGRTPGRERSDPDTLYRVRSHGLPFLVRRPGSEEAEPITLRFVAIHLAKGTMHTLEGAGGDPRGPGEAPTGMPPGRRSAAPLPAQVPPRPRCLCPRRAGHRTAPP